ncbi:MAG TPA: protease pro-enzyme activation domain-containing protein [Steroidobacteraceae bacterium]|nr:protease pro-enzyme activation domain-containing protein [Steroidobacteraceae bacterium]
MKTIFTGIVCALSLAVAATASAAPSGYPAPMITAPVTAGQMSVLAGNTRPEANAANDEGVVADALPLEHLLLQLKRSPEREAALQALIGEMHDSTSASFHQWLTPQDFAQHYGVAQRDVAAVTAWLQGAGFTINGVAASGLTIDFSGTAGQVRAAFRSEIHRFRVGGVEHIANASDPMVPTALLPVVSGIVSLHDFRPRTQQVRRAAHPAYTYTNSNGTFHALVAGDLATIYNLKPLFQAGLTGAGQTIMVVEDTYLYSTRDWSTFRSTFGLTRYQHGSLTQTSPQGALHCANPGFQGKSSDPGYGDDGEAIIDVEWASAAAPDAAIVLAACTDTTTTFGGLIALQNTLNGPVNALPSVVSISYGEAEAANGQSANLSYYYAYQQADAEGVSVFVSSGDEDAASDDVGNPAAHGIGVSGFTSTPYNVSVGGLDFGYTALGVPASDYWSAKNSSTYSSALSYIQEIPWNDSCAGALLASFLGTTPLGLCNSPQVAGTGSDATLSFLANAIGGSGGPSGCALGSPSVSGVVSGSCRGYAKPSWQNGLLGVPADGVRDIPDVSLFAANGIWDAYYVVCWSDPNTDPIVGGGFSCNGAPSTWAGFGGTSVSSPIMAAIQALVNQRTGSRWGNPDNVYYAMARQEYGYSGSSSCNSTTVNKTSNGCVFYDVTQGDNVGACTSLSKAKIYNCYLPKGDTYGVLSALNWLSLPAYPTGTGWDFPSGIGSVNAYNLVMDWPVF